MANIVLRNINERLIQIQMLSDTFPVLSIADDRFVADPFRNLRRNEARK